MKSGIRSTIPKPTIILKSSGRNPYKKGSVNVALLGFINREPSRESVKKLKLPVLAAIIAFPTSIITTTVGNTISSPITFLIHQLKLL
jgi:hypothetical protein